MADADFHVQLLREELARRCERNPRYSLRSFARALAVDAGTTSRLLRGKQLPTLRMARRIFLALEVSPPEQERFLRSMDHARDLPALSRPSGLLKARSRREGTRELPIDLFRLISDSHHAVMLELPRVEGFRSDPAWIAREIGISATEAQLALGRLIQHGLLEVRGRQLVRTGKSLATADRHVTTPALRRNQRQFLEKAIESLENDPIEDRSVSRWTFAADPEKLPLAREMIDRFQRRLARVLESGKPKRVYTVSVALFPNSRPNSRPKGGKP
jgi:uncharacterized protein (TIGR02147 family)